MPLVRINPRRGRSTVGEGDERSPREVHRLHRCHRRHCIDRVKPDGGSIANTPAGDDCRQRQHLYRRKDLCHHARPRERRHLGTNRSARGARFGSRRDYFPFGGKSFTSSPPRSLYPALVTKPVRTSLLRLKTIDQTASRPNMSCPRAPSFRSSTVCYGSTVSSRTCRGY